MSWFAKLITKPKYTPRPLTELELGTLVTSVHRRARILDNVDLFMFSFSKPKSKLLLSELPTVVVGKFPPLVSSSDDAPYQVSVMSPNPEGIDPADVFAAWAGIGFKAFEKHGEYSYGDARLNLTELHIRLLGALRVLSNLYGLESNWKIQVLGDPVLRQVLETDFLPVPRSSYEFSFRLKSSGADRV